MWLEQLQKRKNKFDDTTLELKMKLFTMNINQIRPLIFIE